MHWKECKNITTTAELSNCSYWSSMITVGCPHSTWQVLVFVKCSYKIVKNKENSHKNSFQIAMSLEDDSDYVDESIYDKKPAAAKPIQDEEDVNWWIFIPIKSLQTK